MILIMQNGLFMISTAFVVWFNPSSNFKEATVEKFKSFR